ncbi:MULTISPECIES: vWA domain-containing protein [Salinibaculum]|uniref:vWA domain-containing protein n=1 Tax=Salinibaculum TaxID=2732368 RepID=UPI0030D0BAB7
MTDDNKLELTRRKILGSMGAIGAAGAAAGLGTSAFFSDQETFVNNQLVAGSLDLHVGWEEHYSDWSDDEDDGLASVEMVEPGTTAAADRTGLPLAASSPENGSLITVENVSQARRFLNNTEVGNYSNTSGAAFDPETLDPANACQYLQPGSEQSPVIIDLDDVKPGDFGEVTFSLALCDNPGYLWMNGELKSAAENGLTEPEEEDPDEDGDEDFSVDSIDDDTDNKIELLDAVRTALWYDDGDNLHSGGVGGSSDPLCVQIVLDSSGSMDNPQEKLDNTKLGAKNLAEEILKANSENRVGITFFSESGNDADVKQSVMSTDDEDNDEDDDPQDIETTKSEIDNLSATGSTTAIGTGISEAQSDLESCPDSHDPVMIVLSNGGENANTDPVGEADAACQAGTEVLTIGVVDANQSLLEEIACKPGSLSAPENAFTADTVDEIVGVFDEISEEVVGTEEIFFIGTLREALEALSDGTGVELDGDIPAADGGGTGRNCFSADTRHDIGFAWWLPVDHANEIQTDTATFELGFYTEQCRHNDGSGQAPETATATSTPPPS